MKAKMVRRLTLGAVLALSLHCPAALAGFASAPFEVGWRNPA